MKPATGVFSAANRLRIGAVVKRAAGAALVLSLGLGGFETFRQYRDTQFIDELARNVASAAPAGDRRAQVIALRDFVRANVSYHGAPYSDAERPFFRATARETIQTGLGYCGEDTRAFINLAAALGIPASRINLYGPTPHVVAMAELGPGEQVVVDAQNPPQIPDLETLDHAMFGHGYTDYSTLNLRRLRVGWLFSRVKLTIGPLTYVGENPHAIKAILWFLFAAVLLGLRQGRSVIRYALHRRGWVHVSSLPHAREARDTPGSEQNAGGGQ